MSVLARKKERITPPRKTRIIKSQFGLKNAKTNTKITKIIQYGETKNVERKTKDITVPSTIPRQSATKSHD